jgi:hypothetical protein
MALRSELGDCIKAKPIVFGCALSIAVGIAVDLFFTDDVGADMENP